MHIVTWFIPLSHIFYANDPKFHHKSNKRYDTDSYENFNRKKNLLLGKYLESRSESFLNYDELLLFSNLIYL